ncbi:hypothetical protein [Abyssisolibacter fermentans]|uniref:hypothetical protein n=1 Tax=Abyssisolibacter fermentans TaxID=1766203 RepID=UPI000837065C|nr:hypothetical protein [Abyssisolibacter fermentans]
MGKRYIKITSLNKAFSLTSNYRIGTSKEYNDNYLFALELEQGALDEVGGVVEYCIPFYNEMESQFN